MNEFHPKWHIEFHSIPERPAIEKIVGRFFCLHEQLTKRVSRRCPKEVEAE